MGGGREVRLPLGGVRGGGRVEEVEGEWRRAEEGGWVAMGVEGVGRRSGVDSCRWRRAEEGAWAAMAVEGGGRWCLPC